MRTMFELVTEAMHLELCKYKKRFFKSKGKAEWEEAKEVLQMSHGQAQVMGLQSP